MSLSIVGVLVLVAGVVVVLVCGYFVIDLFIKFFRRD